MDEDVPLANVSPLYMENCSHPLFYINGEEDFRRIDTILPPPVVKLVPPPNEMIASFMLQYSS